MPRLALLLALLFAPAARAAEAPPLLDPDNPEAGPPLIAESGKLWASAHPGGKGKCDPATGICDTLYDLVVRAVPAGRPVKKVKFVLSAANTPEARAAGLRPATDYLAAQKFARPAELQRSGDYHRGAGLEVQFVREGAAIRIAVQEQGTPLPPLFLRARCKPDRDPSDAQAIYAAGPRLLAAQLEACGRDWFFLPLPRPAAPAGD